MTIGGLAAEKRSEQKRPCFGWICVLLGLFEAETPGFPQKMDKGSGPPLAFQSGTDESIT
jgi:hypothetical protein